MEIPFVGGAYEGRSKNLNAQRCINLFPVVDQQGKYPVALYGTPGLVEFADLAVASEVRGMIVCNEFLYAVCGNQLFKVSPYGNATTISGNLSQGSGHVYMSQDGTYVVIVDPRYGAWYYDTSSGANSLTQITDTDFPVPSSLTWQDGFFIVSEFESGRFYISNSYDPTAWESTDYATAESDPDYLQRVFMDHRELWLFGRQTTEVWYNSGAADFPFDPISGAVISYGLAAGQSVASLDNGIFWLDDNRRVVRADGFIPQVISTRQIEYQFAKYRTVADAVAFGYLQEGHAFYQITFPTEKATWVFDASTGFWHQRASWPKQENQTFNRHRGNTHAFFANKHLVGDYANGKIYEMDLDTYTDDGNALIAQRRARAVHQDRLRIFHHELEIEFEAGVGISGTGQGSDPQAVLRWSDNDGHTWSHELWRDMGKIGEYNRRARWHRLGMSTSRIYELTISDPVKRVILAAHLRATPGES